MNFHKETKLCTLFHKIDYDEFELMLRPKSDGGDLGSEKEMELLFLLDFLNGVCAAYEANIFKEEYLVLSSLGYAIQRTAKNTVVRSYLEHVEQHDVLLKAKGRYSFGLPVRSKTYRAFQHFQDVSDRLEAIGRNIQTL